MSQADGKLRFDFSHPGLWIPAYLPLNWKKARYKLLYGSRGRGATTNVVQVIAARMLSEQMKGMMVRKVFEDIQGSQWDSFRDWAEKHKMDQHFVFQKAPLEIICKPTGSRLISRGLNKPGRAKSVPDLSLAWYEEADELSAEDFRQSSLSIRGDNIEEWLTFNSPQVDHWLLERFFPGTRNKDGEFEPDLSFEQPDGDFTWVPSTDSNAVIMHASYHHNPFTKPEYISIMDRDRLRDPEAYRVSGLGLIGKMRTGMEFFHAFKGDREREIPFDPKKALHVTLDFNAMPYMTCLVSQIWQEGDVWRVHFLKEYCPKPPLSYTKATVQMLADDIKGGTFQGLEAGLFYYGDASGKNNSSMATEEARNNFDHVKNGLRPWLLNGSNRVLKSNPPHTKVRDFMNACFFGDTGIDITFDPSMKTTIRDLRNLKQGADGSILEEKETDEATGVKFVKWGHASQACYYLIVSAFKGHYQHHAKKAA
jgi:phage terminase large subunit